MRKSNNIGRKATRYTNPPFWGVRIAEARRRLDWSQADLARAIGKGQSAIGTYETGQAEPNIPTLLAIAEALMVTPGWLITPDENNPEAQASAFLRGHKDDRLFVWTLVETAKLLSEEGLHGDRAFTILYANQFMRAGKGVEDDADAKKLISAAIEAERLKLRAGLDQILKRPL